MEERSAQCKEERENYAAFVKMGEITTLCNHGGDNCTMPCTERQWSVLKREKRQCCVQTEEENSLCCRRARLGLALLPVLKERERDRAIACVKNGCVSVCVDDVKDPLFFFFFVCVFFVSYIYLVYLQGRDVEAHFFSAFSNHDIYKPDLSG